jgi:hypothetical protein
LSVDDDNAATLRDRLLGPLSMHFDAASRAYDDYMKAGRSYLFACSLRRINAAARLLLLEHGHLLPTELRGDALDLIRHYDAWLTLWDDHAAAMKPAYDHEFVFDSIVRFPREAQRRLMKEYRTTS